jgi:hypothetical protein
LQRAIFADQDGIGSDFGTKPLAPISIETYIDGCFDKKGAYILYGMVFSIVFQTKIGGVEKVFRIKTPPNAYADLPYQAIPHFSTDIYICHGHPSRSSLGVDFSNCPGRNIFDEAFDDLFVYRTGKKAFTETQRKDLQNGRC